MELLHSRILGEGQPFIIVHGYFGMGDNWKTLANKFAENYQVHIVDQRNHGRSFHTDEFDYDLMVEDLENYIEHYELENVILMGHSMGGKTAMQFAVEYPEKLDKLIAVDIAPRYYQPHHNEILKALNSVDFSIHNSRKLVDQQLANYIDDIGVRGFLLKNVYWKEKGQLAFRFNLQSLTDNNPEVGKALESFTEFDGETLFIAGGNSGYITQDELPLIKAHFPNATVKTIANAGHWVHAEKPMEFYTTVTNFLTTND